MSAFDVITRHACVSREVEKLDVGKMEHFEWQPYIYVFLMDIYLLHKIKKLWPITISFSENFSSD